MNDLGAFERENLDSHEVGKKRGQTRAENPGGSTRGHHMKEREGERKGWKALRHTWWNPYEIMK